ncbi:MAG: CPBP family intramembrane metalloprotease [Oscillospiraceae bacterium]|nr:CPBP family intramembrane metalloprotease [Oscillospiraceae bacterium]
MKKRVTYVVLAMLCSFLVVGGYFLDTWLGYADLFENGAKILLIVFLLVYAIRNGDLEKYFSFSRFERIGLLAFLPAIGNLASMAPADLDPSAHDILLAIWGTLTTAIWEELLFRYVGGVWFEKDGKYSLADILFLCAVFSLPHLVNILYQSVVSTFLQMLLAFGMGLFFLALYRGTSNILIPIFSHFLLNASAQLISLYQSGSVSPYLGWTASEVLFVLIESGCAFIGLLMLFRDRKRNRIQT